MCSVDLLFFNASALNISKEEKGILIKPAKKFYNIVNFFCDPDIIL